MSFRTLRPLLATVAAVMVAVSTGAQAQGKPIRLLVGYAAGGPVDQTARILATPLGELLGTTVVVENKGGAGGTLAGTDAARARPDGTVLWMAASPTITISPNVMSKMRFDPAKDLTPIAPVLSYYNVLMAHPEQPYKNVEELVAHARQNPGEISYGSSGVGASNHLGVALFAEKADINLNHIPYRGNAPAVTDLLGGQINMMMDIVSTAAPYLQSGQLRPIAIMAPERNASIPDVPTFTEAGLADLEIGGWYGVYGPKGLGAEEQKRLNDAINTVLKQPEIKKRLEDLGYEIWSGTPEMLAERAASDRATWATVTQDIQID